MYSIQRIVASSCFRATRKLICIDIKNIGTPTNSVISASDYIISDSNYIITTTDYIIADADYRINRHSRKNYSRRKEGFLSIRKRKLLLLNWCDYWKRIG